MKNLLKIPKLNLSRFLKPTKIFAMAVLLPLAGGWGATSCSLADALKPTPQIDQYGLDKNAAFACLVNGQKWEPSSKNPLFVVNPSADYDVQNKILGVGGENVRDKSFEVFSMRVENFSKAMKYQLPENKITLMYYDQKKFPYGQTGKIPKAFSGYIEVSKFDTIKRQTTGTFEFKTLDYNGDTLNITAGRFNLNF
jgi:hypothetical protein